MGSDGLDFIFLGELVLGRAEPKTRKAQNPKSPKTRAFWASPMAREPAGWENSRPDPNTFKFRATGQIISGKVSMFFVKCNVEKC